MLNNYDNLEGLRHSGSWYIFTSIDFDVHLKEMYGRNPAYIGTHIHTLLYDIL